MIDSIQTITILGSTGSIGQSTLDVLSQHPHKFSVFALTAHVQSEKLLQQCQIFKPRYAVLFDDKAAHDLQQKLNQLELTTEVRAGPEALAFVAGHADVDVVMAAIVGAAGLLPTLAAAEQGKKILLANKESLVMAGQLFMQAIEASGAQLLPIDSEHNAIFQCLPQKSMTKTQLFKQGGC